MSYQQEKERVTPRVTRREFFLIAIALLTTSLFSCLDLRNSNDNVSLFNLEKIKNLNVILPERLPPNELIGINLNAPFLWREVNSPEKIKKAIENAYQFKARTIRVFINDDFEPKLGEYRYEVLEKIGRLAQEYPLQVDLFDAFSLFHSNKLNLVYGSFPLSSPYLGVDFFADKSLEIFLKRVRRIISYLNHVPGIVAWSVANELEVPHTEKEKAREILTGWYEEVIKTIRSLDPKRPILSGVADPTLLDEERLKACGLTANTIHLYPNPFKNLLKSYYQPKHKKILPLICQEIGFPSRVLGVSFDFFYDKLLSRYLTNNLLSFFKIDEKKGLITPEITSIGVWRLSFEGDLHQDGFELIPKNIPLTIKTLHFWSEIVEKILN